MTREEFERELQEKLGFRELAPGTWVGQTGIPELATLQPFTVMVRLLELGRKKPDSQSNESLPAREGAIGVAINLGLRVEGNHESVFEYLLKVNGSKTLGAFILSDNDELAISAELPSGSSPDRFFSSEALGVLLGALMGTVKEHYHRIVQLVTQQEKPADVSTILDKFKRLGGKSAKD